MDEPVKRSKYNGYRNYKLSRTTTNEIETIHLDDPKITTEWFFDNFIKPRKPALIKYSNSGKFKVNVEKFKPDQLLPTLTEANDGDDNNDDELLQVEELNHGGFGSGQKRLKINMKDFLERIKKGESLYLTTQYTENDPDLEEEEINEEEEEEDDDDDDDGDGDGDGKGLDGQSKGFNLYDSNLSDTENFSDLHDDFDEEDELEDLQEILEESNLIYQPPLSNLLNGKLHHLPLHAASITESLIPQQINLWCGRTPSETEQLSIQHDSNGDVIDVNRGLPAINATSTGLHHDHADNLYVLVQGKKRFTLFSPDFAHDLYTTGDIRHIYDTGVIDYINNEKAPHWTSVRSDGSLVEASENECLNLKRKTETRKETGEKQDPPSFCKIPPVLLHLNETDEKTKEELKNYALKTFPNFADVKDSSLKVTLEDGDLLYLPAGWFHEVTSYGDESKNNTHVAINYWFVPPDGDSVHNAYIDPTWREDFELWKKKFM